MVSKPTILDEKIFLSKSSYHWFWQCLAMMPGTSRSAASIIGGMTQGLSRKAAAEFSFPPVLPTMLAVTVYSVFVKHGEKELILLKDDFYKMKITSTFILGNIIAFVVALLAVKTFISVLQNTVSNFGVGTEL
jgi:undecaprenyl-diphosphatase